ncbi:acetolactate synthase large subunit [Clostridiales bacterium BAD-6]|uniref:Acetolactate synthase large subunit n=2 Tax=Sinanaerobacter chloroacetimidivorans TaxID=2818044 RepID=A0A8J8B132_9FIRM|nr:acetolactate synthase large subunit [Sinanaerobacter chloroacetimidivorans]MBR0597819.1 acetolactate synthase large subunit [Sinanaerobacter chloroacetimidivorans]
MENKQLNTAELMVKCLEAEGVEYIFGIPGEENLALVAALKNSSIQFVTTRHEQGAAFMADMYGRLTGKAGVCLSTLGPGATNLVTGVADAQGDGAPLVAITGQVGTDKMHITSHQLLDLTKMFEPITKRAKIVVRPDTIGEIVRLAFKYAESERPGATYIDLPVNISKMMVSDEEKPLKRAKANLKEFASMQNVELAAAEIFRAQNPVILAGSGAVRAGASHALTHFAEELKIPVVNTMMAKGVIPIDNPYAMMTVGIPQKDYANKILESADLVIAVGYDLVEFAPAVWNQQRKIKIIHIGSSPADTNKCYQCTVEVVGDMTESLNSIARRTTRNTEPEHAIKVYKRFSEEQKLYEEDDSFPMKPQKIIHDVRKFLGKDDILVSDVGAHKMWIGRLYGCYQPNTCIISNGFASMGIGVPGAVAAKLVHPDKKIITITGDGGFAMNSQELETAVRLGLNFAVLIFNDSGYGLIKWRQLDQYGESHNVDFTNPDFVKLAEAMNCKGYKVEKAGDLMPILEEAFKQKVPAIIDCAVDYSENTKLTEHLKKICEDPEL